MQTRDLPFSPAHVFRAKISQEKYVCHYIDICTLDKITDLRRLLCRKVLCLRCALLGKGALHSEEFHMVGPWWGLTLRTGTVGMFLSVHQNKIDTYVYDSVTLLLAMKPVKNDRQVLGWSQNPTSPPDPGPCAPGPGLRALGPGPRPQALGLGDWAPACLGP